MNSLWDILSVAIGISFVFMILSILNSWIQEYIATLFHLRAKNLADIIQNLLEPGAEKLNGTKRALADLFPVFLANSAESGISEGQGNESAASLDRETRFAPYVAQTGDTLSKIAAAQLGDVGRWQDIWNLNRDRVANENLIYPRLVLLMP